MTPLFFFFLTTGSKKKVDLIFGWAVISASEYKSTECTGPIPVTACTYYIRANASLKQFSGFGKGFDVSDCTSTAVSPTTVVGSLSIVFGLINIKIAKQIYLSRTLKLRLKRLQFEPHFKITVERLQLVRNAGNNGNNQFNMKFYLRKKFRNLFRQLPPAPPRIVLFFFHTRFQSPL